MNQNLVRLWVLWPPRSFVTPKCFYKQPLNRSRWFFACITPRHPQKNVAIYWYNKLRRFSIIITWRHKIATHFTREKKYFLEHSGFPPVVTFLAHFYQKACVEANVNVSDIFTKHFVRNCSLTICHFMTIAYTWMNCKQLIVYLIYAIFMPIHQQVS